jgi:hypothetical protein
LTSAAAKLGKDAALTQALTMHKIRMIRSRPAANCGDGGIFSAHQNKTPGTMGMIVHGRESSLPAQGRRFEPQQSRSRSAADALAFRMS